MAITRGVSKLIFDNDGVNIDSEDVAMRVMDDWGVDLIKRCEPARVPAQDYIYKTYPGTSTDKIVEALIKKFDLPVALIKQDYNLADDADVPVEIANLITLEINKRFQSELKAIPGVTAAHDELRAAYGAENIALATTSRADRMNISLECAVDPVTGANARLTEFFPAGELRRSHAGRLDGLRAQPTAFERLKSEITVRDEITAAGITLDATALAFSKFYAFGH